MVRRAFRGGTIPTRIIERTSRMARGSTVHTVFQWGGAGGFSHISVTSATEGREALGRVRGPTNPSLDCRDGRRSQAQERRRLYGTLADCVRSHAVTPAQSLTGESGLLVIKQLGITTACRVYLNTHEGLPQPPRGGIQKSTAWMMGAEILLRSEPWSAISRYALESDIYQDMPAGSISTPPPHPSPPILKA